MAAVEVHGLVCCGYSCRACLLAALPLRCFPLQGLLDNGVSASDIVRMGGYEKTSDRLKQLHLKNMATGTVRCPSQASSVQRSAQAVIIARVLHPRICRHVGLRLLFHDATTSTALCPSRPLPFHVLPLTCFCWNQPNRHTMYGIFNRVEAAEERLEQLRAALVALQAKDSG